MRNNIRASRGGGALVAPTQLLKLLPLLVGLSPAVALAQYHLSFTPGQPTTTVAGVYIKTGTAGPLKVAVQDALNNTVTTGPASTASITVSIGTNPGGGTLSGTVTVSAVAGIATFSDLSIDKVGVGYRLMATAMTILGATSNAFNINSAAPSRLAFTTPSRTFTAGACGGAGQVITVQLQDAYGNRVAAPAGGVAFTASSTSTGTVGWYTDSVCSLSANGGNFTIAASSTSADVYYTDTKAGTPSISLANGSGLTNPAPQSHTVISAAEDRLAFIVQPANTTVGAAISPAVQVAVQDAFGNTATSSTANITVAIGSNPGGGTLSGTTTVSAVSGVATFSNLSIDQLGTGYTLSATSTSLTGATSTAFNIVTAGVASRLAFTVQPTSATAGSAISPSVQVTVQDASGNTVTTSTASITVAIGTNPSGGTLSGTTTVAPVNGVATFSNLSIDKVGTGYTLTAASPSLTGATSSAFNISPAAANRLAFTVQPMNAVVGVLFPVEVAVQDAFGNTVTSSTASITLAIGSNPGGGTLSCITTVPAVNGVASFSCSIDKVGTGYTLTAASPGLTGATSATFNISSAAPAKLAFTVQPPMNTVAGVSITPAVQVTVQDAFGNTVTSSTASITVAIGTNPGGGTLSGTTTVSAVAGVATFSNLSIDKVGTGYTLTAASPAVTGAISSAFNISHAAAAKLAFTVQPTNATAGVAIVPAVQVTVQDAFNNTVTSSTASITVAIGTNPGGGTLSGTTTVPAVAGVATFSNLSIDKVGTGYTLTAASAALIGVTSTAFNINPAAPNRLAFVTPPRTMTAGACSPLLTVQTRDVFDNPAPAASSITVTLASSSATGGFFVDSACSAPSTMVVVATGTSTASFYYRDTTAGSPSVTASVAGLTSATQVETINAGLPTQLAFTTPPQTLTAGACSGAVTVQTRDAFNNPTALASEGTVGLSSTSGTLRFYQDAACTTVIASASIAPGAGTTTFYFRDTTVGLPHTTATAPSLSPADQQQQIDPGAAAALVFTTASQTLVPGGCSGIITIQAQDGFGNPSGVSSATVVSLATTSTGGVFYADSTCSSAPITGVTISAGSAAASFYYRDTRSGTPTLTASAAGLTAATQVETISGGGLYQLVFLTAPQTLVAGNCSAVATLQFQDYYGSPLPVTVPTVVDLTSGSAAGTFYSDSNCATAPITSVTAPTGVSIVNFFFKDTWAGTPTLTAASSGLVSATQAQTIVAGPAAKLRYVTAPRTISAGACSANITVEARDAFDNPSSVGAATPVGLSTTSAGGRFYSDSACTTPVLSVIIPAGGTSASFYYRDTTAGTPTLTASNPGLTAATQVETIDLGLPDQLAFATAPQVLVAGACSAAVTVEMRDAFGNRSIVAAATLLSLASSSPTTVFYADPACTAIVTGVTIPAGSSTASFYFKDTTAGTATLTATAAGLTSATQVETIRPAVPSKLAFSTPPRQTGVGACSPVLTVESRDSLDNASPVASTVPVNLSSTSTTVTFFSDSLCTVPVTGLSLVSGSSAVSFYFQDSMPGQQTLTASAVGFMSASQVETMVAAGGTPTALAFITPPPTFEANACSPAVMAETQDQNGVTAPVTAAMGNVTVALTSASSTLSFYSDATCTTAITQVTLATGQSRAVMYLKDTIARPTTITALAPAAMLTSATQGVTVICPAVGTAACDDNDLCNGRETCQAGVCTPSAPPSCDDSNVCTTDSCQPATGCSNEPVSDPTCCAPPAILAEANPNAAVGVPYRYSASGAARVSLDTGTIAWSLCDSPPAGFRIDATTGRVDWTPAVAGTVNLCLAAQGTCGQFEYRFSVSVAPTAPSMPVASLTLTPSTVDVGAPLTADGRLSSTTQPPLYAMELDFGDGSPLAYGDLVTHVYQKAGSYPVRLRVYDSVGQFADALAVAKVADAACASPPEVRIAASQTTGQNRITVSFTSTYDGSDSNAVYRWDLGDGTTATGASVTHEYTAGRYTARLSVVSAQGCTSVDAVPIAVNAAANLAPYCRVSLTPAAGPAPLPVTITGTFGDVDGYVASATWLFSDGITLDATRYNGTTSSTLSNPGKLSVTLRVVDDQGLVCSASGEVEAGNATGVFAPEIVTMPTLTAQCGEPYVYGQDGIARATGSRPLTWSLGQGDPAVGVPAGMTIDGNGQIQWTPRKKAVKEPVTVMAENAAGVALQGFVVDVECANPDPLIDCGCSSGAGAAPLALLLLASFARRWRRRPGQTNRGED